MDSVTPGNEVKMQFDQRAEIYQLSGGAGGALLPDSIWSGLLDSECAFTAVMFLQHILNIRLVIR